MAAPTFVVASDGATDATGAWQYNPPAIFTSGQVAILQVLQDGTTSGAVTVTGTSGNVEDLAGTAGEFTFIGEFAVGSATAALQYLWICRMTGGQIGTVGGTNSTSEDVYVRAYAFQNVSTGTTLATVIENSTAGATANGVGTSATAADTAVVTLGPDRLALNLLAINDDNPFAGFTGESGGTWTTRASYAEASGTDGAIYLADAAMASAGTIDGGTGSITDSDAWGVVGFALIGTTPSVAVPRNPAINFQDPGVL